MSTQRRIDPHDSQGHDLELWQAEWCPSSRRVRQRLTELELPFRALQVPAERAERDELEAAVS